MTQMTLHLAPLVIPEREPEATIAERFDAFHEVNPWVADAMEALIADWLSHGHKRASTKWAIEIIRWQYGRETTGDQGFRLNSDFTSRYARLLIERHPSWADAIHTRQLRAA